MKSELRNVLAKMDEVDFLELISALNIAKYARGILEDYDLDIEELCKKLELDFESVRSILWGYYPYDIRIMSKLEAIQHDLEKSKTEKLKKRLIELPDYTDSVPVKYLAQFAAMIQKEFKSNDKAGV